MPDFNQNVKINVDLNAKTEGALAEIGSALTAIKSSANSLGDDLDQIEKDIEDFGESFGKDDDIQIGGEVDSDSIFRAVRNARQQAHTEIKSLPQPTVRIATRMDSRRGTFVDEILDEIQMLEDATEAADPLAEAKENVADSNSLLADSADNSVTELDREADSFDKIIDSGDSLTDVKQKVADANKHVQSMSKESADELAGEDKRMRDLFDSAGIVEESIDEAGDTMGATSRQLRKMRNSTDKATESMRAAAQVGDLFEDGLGSLSVNLGAFTVALRNFLTQVPLLLTALGAAGAAAMGAASGFVALAGAMGAVVAAGAIAHAQQLKSEYSEIENLGESMQVIMANLRDLFMEAIQPLTSSGESLQIFVQAATGLARAVNVISKSIARLVEGTDEFNESVAAGAEPIFTVQDAMTQWSEDVMPAFLDLVGSIGFAFEELGSEIISATARATSGLADMIDFSVRLFGEIENVGSLISQFGDTMAELATLGVRVGGGLLPVFKAFSSVMEGVANALNQIDSQTMQNAVTFLVLMAAINRLAGVASSLLTIFPNLVVGMANVSSSAKAASGSIATMRAATAAAGTQLGGFLAQTNMLGGMTAFAAALTGTGERMRNVAFNTVAASEAFEEMAEDTDHASDELRELAIQGKLTEEVMEDLGDNDDIDFDVSDGKLDAEQFLPDDSLTAAMFGGADDAAEEAAEESAEAMGRLDPRGGTFRVVPDDIDAGPLDKVKGKLRGLGQSFRNAGAAALDAVKQFGLFLGRLVMIQLQAIKTAIVMSGRLAASMARVAIASAKAAASILKQTVMVYQYTGSLTAAASTMWGLVTAQIASAAASARNAAMKEAGAAANFLLSDSALLATGSMYALDTSIAVATGGISVLVGLIGALAVGIITNFSEIKAAASDSFGFLKDVIDIIVDVLITYFIETWNLIVDLFNAVVQGLSPLIDMFADLGKALGVVGGESQDSASFMEMLAAAGDIVKTSLKVLADFLGVIIDVLGGVLAVATSLIRVALTPLLVVVQLIIAALGLLSDWWDFILEDILGVQGGVSGLIDIFMDLFDAFMAGMAAIPAMVEKAVNGVIGLINGFFSAINNTVPGVDLGQIEDVSFTGEQSMKTDREELAADSKNMRDNTAEKSDKTITYNEDNSTNIDQTVNADPEDQAQLSRVVTDAIAEANSFERRRQGGQ